MGKNRSKRRREQFEDPDDADEEVQPDQKAVRFDDSLPAKEDLDGNEMEGGDLEEQKGSRLTREEDEDDDDGPAPRREGAMAGNDDEVDVKIVHGRITKVEGEEDGDIDDDYEEGGIKIIPFNLKAERESGHFDQSGHYVENEFEENRDAWLDELEEAEKDLKRDVQKGEKKTFNKVEIAEFDDDEKIDMLELKRSIVSILQPKEQVRHALKRLRGTGKKPSAEGKDEFNTLMEAANNLLQVGEFGIYNDTKESIEAALQQAEKESDEGLWDYKLTEDGEEHGPFTTAQMAEWASQGYFSAENPALVRMRDPRTPLDDIPFQRSTEVDFAAYADLMDL